MRYLKTKVFTIIHFIVITELFFLQGTYGDNDFIFLNITFYWMFSCSILVVSVLTEWPAWVDNN